MKVDLEKLRSVAKNIKAVFFDIDGTLVSFKTHKIHPNNLQVLDALRAKGIKVFVCTGRMVKMTEVLDGVDFDGFIANNGATCYVPYTEKDAIEGVEPVEVGSRKLRLIADRPLPESQLLAIKQRLERKDLPSFHVSFMGAENYYLNAPSDVALKIAEEVAVAPPPVTPLEEILRHKIYQLCIYLFGKELDEVMKFIPECEAASWHPLFADVNQKGTDKGYGIDRMLEHFGLDLSQSLSFGDGGNDIPMLRHTALSVAMGNATEDVANASDYLTDTVDNDGILKALSELRILG
ncbi:MAG: HAD-IIB family hydrolase [Candidatus Egerieousia sp.]